MKPLLNTIFLFLLVIGFSGGVSGQDFEETKRLAEQGNASAQSDLGFMYDNGLGVPEDDAEAVRWFRLAAEQGYATAQSSLGVMYFYGDGVPQNNLRAICGCQYLSLTFFSQKFFTGKYSHAHL